MVSQALNLINKKHEVKKLRDEISTLTTAVDTKTQQLSDLKEQNETLTLDIKNEKLRTKIFLESLQSGFEKELSKSTERSYALNTLGRDLEDLRL